MKNRFELIVFDWDGTLIDSIHWITDCLQLAARDCGLAVPPTRLAKSVIGLSLDRAMATMFPGAPSADIDALMLAYHRYYDVRELGREDLFAGVPEMLDTLKGLGFKLAVATGKTREGLNHALNSSGASTWFHSTRAAGETASKPNPLMLVQLMEELAAPPERTLMVGDSVHDLQMAKNAGIEAVAVACGANDREELMALEPLLLLDQVAQLLNHIA